MYHDTLNDWYNIYHQYWLHWYIGKWYTALLKTRTGSEIDCIQEVLHIYTAATHTKYTRNIPILTLTQKAKDHTLNTI